MSEQRGSRIVLLALAAIAVALVVLTHGKPPLHAPAGTPPPASARSAPQAPRLTATVKRTTLGFLGSYLAFVYRDERSIKDASGSLRRRLLAHPPRVLPAPARRHPTVLSLRPVAASDGRIGVRASIDAGGLLRYQLLLRLAASGNRGALRVSELEGATG